MCDARVPSSLRPLFGPSAEQNRDALYSEARVQQALLEYREQQHLAAPGGCIKLDRLTPSMCLHLRGMTLLQVPLNKLCSDSMSSK